MIHLPYFKRKFFTQSIAICLFVWNTPVFAQNGIGAIADISVAPTTMFNQINPDAVGTADVSIPFWKGRPILEVIYASRGRSQFGVSDRIFRRGFSAVTFSEQIDQYFATNQAAILA